MNINDSAWQRREFLLQLAALSAAAGLTNPTFAQQGKPMAEVQGKRRMIVDAQVHLWLPEGPNRPWPKGGAARAQLPFAFTQEMLLKD